jgi:hypothetical protein
MIENNIVILSLGWLGSSLVKKLESDWVIKGAYYSSKKNIMNEFYFDINSVGSCQQIESANIIIFAIPPSKINSVECFNYFLNTLKNQKIIFISSTSVYGEQGEVNEKTIPIPNTQNGHFLLECEKLISKRSRYCIIRSSGQYGDERHPGKSMAGKLKNFGINERINLIDLESLLDIIEKNIVSDKYKVINAVNINHPLKSEFYQIYSNLNHLKSPVIKIIEKEINYKVINTLYSDFKVKKILF